MFEPDCHTRNINQRTSRKNYILIFSLLSGVGRAIVLEKYPKSGSEQELSDTKQELYSWFWYEVSVRQPGSSRKTCDNSRVGPVNSFQIRTCTIPDPFRSHCGFTGNHEYSICCIFVFEIFLWTQALNKHYCNIGACSPCPNESVQAGFDYNLWRRNTEH
jgi:hypothetical protein